MLRPDDGQRACARRQRAAGRPLRGRTRRQGRHHLAILRSGRGGTGLHHRQPAQDRDRPAQYQQWPDHASRSHRQRRNFRGFGSRSRRPHPRRRRPAAAGRLHNPQLRQPAGADRRCRRRRANHGQRDGPDRRPGQARAEHHQYLQHRLPPRRQRRRSHHPALRWRRGCPGHAQRRQADRGRREQRADTGKPAPSPRCHRFRHPGGQRRAAQQRRWFAPGNQYQRRLRQHGLPDRQ